jgi:hypothetical protein
MSSLIRQRRVYVPYLKEVGSGPNNAVTSYRLPIQDVALRIL